MGRELTVAFADDGMVIGSYGAIAITVLTQPSTLGRLAELRRHLTRLQRAWPDGTYSLTVIGRGSMVASVPAEIRDESTSIARAFPSLGSTIVVEGEGFAGATMRAFLSGLFLISRNRSQIHGTVSEASVWLAKRMTTEGAASDLAAELEAAVESARRAIG
jgi:hypothetical protein